MMRPAREPEISRATSRKAPTAPSAIVKAKEGTQIRQLLITLILPNYPVSDDHVNDNAQPPKTTDDRGPLNPAVRAPTQNYEGAPEEGTHGDTAGHEADSERRALQEGAGDQGRERKGENRGAHISNKPGDAVRAPPFLGELAQSFKFVAILGLFGAYYW